MVAESNLEALKPHVRKAILRGDFLLSINRFSDVWIYLRLMNNEEVRNLIRDVLVDFWSRFLECNEGDYVLVAAEHVEEFSEDEIPTAIIAEEAVDLLNTPKLTFVKLLVDTEDDFELFLEDVPTDGTVMLFAALSIHLDLLKQVIKQLNEMACSVLGVLVILEREKISGPAIRNELGAELVPFMIYEEEDNKLSSIKEIDEPPYSRYHEYFE